MSPLWLVLLLPVLGGAERFNCRGRILGAYYADAKSGCKAFHVCVRVAGGGIRDFRFYCPPGTLFHQEAQTCTDWGDDDPLACPADLYDGQFDLYKIGSAYDTKKTSSVNREEESEFGLQRAETGDRRLAQNPSANSAASDLRTAHSSDFFSGQRDRGRDESVPPPQPPASANARQTFRRPTTTQQPTYPTTQFNTQPTSSPQSVTQSNYVKLKTRKIPRHRPIYSSSTPYPNDSSDNFQKQSFSEQQKHEYTNKQQIYSDPSKQDAPRKQQSYSEQSKQDISRQAQNYFKPQKQDFGRQPQSNPEQQRQNLDRQPKSYSEQPKQDFNRPPQNYPEQQKKDNNRRPQVNPEQSNQNVNRKPSFENIQNPPSIKNLPLKYQDEYVEVPRVSPKTSNRYYPNSPSSPSYFSSTQAPNNNNQKGLVELYNLDTQSTPGAKSQNENKAFKVKNSFNVQSSKDSDYIRNQNYFISASSTPAIDFNSVRGSSTPSYTNFNSVSYEPEKNNFIDISSAKQNYFYTTTTTPFTTTIFTTTRFEPSLNVNTIAYNTNLGFDTQSPLYSESIEDDGQYRPPQGEDDGQYRPELYERESELLTGAHSLNIAASNRLPEEQKQSKAKEEKSFSKGAAPRPFRPVPTPFTTSTTQVPENYPTTQKPRKEPSTPRNFDYYQTYTTTSRPYDAPPVPERQSVSVNNPTAVLKLNTESVPRPTNRPSSRETYPTTIPANAPKSTRRPHFSKPPKKNEDSSYDYAYYDSDPGFSEYDQIEEFGKTNTKL